MRGNGGRIYKVEKNTNLPRDWTAFLRNDENKTLLISFLAEEETLQIQQDHNLIIITKGDSCVTKRKQIPDSSCMLMMRLRLEVHQ